jgi:hypothetical protein
VRSRTFNSSFQRFFWSRLIGLGDAAELAAHQADLAEKTLALRLPRYATARMQ